MTLAGGLLQEKRGNTWVIKIMLVKIAMICFKYIFILIIKTIFWNSIPCTDFVKKKQPSDKVASLWGEILQRGGIKAWQK